MPKQLTEWQHEVLIDEANRHTPARTGGPTNEAVCRCGERTPWVGHVMDGWACPQAERLLEAFGL